MKFPFCTALAATLTLAAQSLAAAEETLELRLVTNDVGVMSHADEAAGNLALEATKSIGVAVFSDGRIAFKQFVYLSMSGDNPQASPGFSSYSFENGDSLQVSFIAAPGDGGFFVNYTVLGGTGAYVGASGTGKLALQDNPWSDATLWKGTFTVATP